MSITIGQHQFDGPYSTTGPLEDRSGAYASSIVAESATVRSRVKKHERSSRWERQSKGRLGVAAYYTPGLQ